MLISKVCESRFRSATVCPISSSQIYAAVLKKTFIKRTQVTNYTYFVGTSVGPKECRDNCNITLLPSDNCAQEGNSLDLGVVVEVIVVEDYTESVDWEV